MFDSLRFRWLRIKLYCMLYQQWFSMVPRNERNHTRSAYLVMQMNSLWNRMSEPERIVASRKTDEWEVNLHRKAA